MKTENLVWLVEFLEAGGFLDTMIRAVWLAASLASDAAEYGLFGEYC